MDSLTLIQYRNYTEKTFELDRHSMFVGPNGSGKTNVIEALRTLSVTKSYRANQDRDTIQWGASSCRVMLDREVRLEYVLAEEDFGIKKVFRHDGLAVPLDRIYGLFPTVLFSPETMSLIDGAPVERRRFLDTVLSQADRGYIEALLTYRKVMRERHFVLLRLQQGLGDSEELNFWDRELTRTGAYIICQRLAFVECLNGFLAQIYPQFHGAVKETLIVQYKPSCASDDLGGRLRSSRASDIHLAATGVGPHRDELVFLLNDRDASLFASRGELRRCILSTKLAEASFLQDRTKTEPTLLLDDVFSELDLSHRRGFLAAVAAYRTVTTTTDEDHLKSSLPDRAKIHRLERADGEN